MNEQTIINFITMYAQLYSAYQEEQYLMQAKRCVKRLQRLKGFQTFEQAFDYFEQQFVEVAV